MNIFKSFLAIFFLIVTVVGISMTQLTSETSVIETVIADDNTVVVEDNAESVMVDEIVYPHDEVVSVNIEISTSDYNDMIENAMDEDIYLCDITYNGYTLTNVAIRTKGNSSLKNVADSDGDRFSFNIDLNYYVDQDLFGIDKLILNNLYMDPSMMAEYIGYEAFDSLDAVSSRTTYTALYINDEYYGLYLSVESVSNEFLETNYGDSLGELYKPEMGVGSDLAYISDDGDDYTGLINDNSEDTSNDAVAELISAIETGENIDDIFNVDSFLQYLAISTYTIHLDTYQSGMFHNYYLYNDDGVFQWIAWDLNMTFNGFPGVSMTDEQATQFLIDEPVVGSMDEYPLVEIILANEEYLAQYHSYLQELMDNYFDEDTFEQRVLEIYEMINTYVKTDSNSFYTYTEFSNALFVDGESSYSLLQFVEERNTNIEDQLSGVLTSTNDGLGNISTGGGLPNQGVGDRPTGQPPGQNAGGLPGAEVIDEPIAGVDSPLDVTDPSIDTSSLLYTIGGGALMILGITYLKRKF